MGDSEKNLQAALAKFSEISKKGFDKAKESIIHSSHSVKLRLELNSLKKERTRIFSGLGEELYNAVKDGKLKTKLFDDSIKNIEDLSSQIDLKEKELSEAGERPAAPAEKPAKQPPRKAAPKTTPVKKEAPKKESVKKEEVAEEEKKKTED